MLVGQDRQRHEPSLRTWAGGHRPGLLGCAPSLLRDDSLLESHRSQPLSRSATDLEEAPARTEARGHREARVWYAERAGEYRPQDGIAVLAL